MEKKEQKQRDVLATWGRGLGCGVAGPPGGNPFQAAGAERHYRSPTLDKWGSGGADRRAVYI